MAEWRWSRPMTSSAMARRVAEFCLTGAVTQVVARKRCSTASVRLYHVAQRAFCSASLSESSGSVSFPSLVSSKDRVGFPRPQEIPWQKELVNSVNLIGRISRNVDVTYLASGTVSARTSIDVVAEHLDHVRRPNVFELVFWDELAEIAATHLKKDDQVFVTGSIWVESFMDKEKYLKTSCKVVAKDLKLVVPEQQEFSSYAPSTNLVVHKNAKLEEEHEEKGFTTSRRNLEDAWTELFENPSNFWDNRNKKKNVNSPDFRHKSRPISLWINDVNIPAWVPERLSSGCLDVSKEDPYPKSERLWQEFFTCPSEWWDNRAKKLSLKSPDFKNKSTGEALWINSTFTPKWVEAQLELYDAKNRTAKADYMDSSWTKVFDKKAAYVSSEGDEFSVI